MPTDSDLATFADPSLDQHFLVSEEKLSKLVSAAGIRPEDRVVEFGAGAGTVARSLPPSASLTVVEFDERLLGFLRDNVPHARVIHGDALTLVREIPCDVLIGNLPHWVTDELVSVLSEISFRTAVLAVGESTVLDRLGPTLRWEEIDRITGDDFLPPQEGVSLLVKVEHQTPQGG